MKPYVESDAMPIVLSQLSLSRTQYCKLADEQFSGTYTYIRTEPHLIFRYPIVEFDKYHICPDPHLLLDRMTKLLHRSVYQYFVDNGKLQEYAGTFGEVYKDYIGILLKDCYGEANVLDLDQIVDCGGRKADWVVTLGNVAAIIECKAQRYPRELSRSGNMDTLESFVNERIGPAFEQLRQTEKQWHVIQDGFPLAKVVNRILKFIVFEEHFHFANVIADFLPHNTVTRELGDSDTHIISTLDLEIVASSNYRSDFSSVFIGWLDRISDFPALHQHVQNLPDFEFTDDNFLEKKFNEFFHKADGG